MFPHWFSGYFISNHINCEKKENLCYYSFQMELQESSFREIDAIYLRNMVHEVKVQETKRIGLEMSKEVSQLPQCSWKQHNKCTRYLLKIYNTPGHEISH